jgi:hypothetical protein
MPIRINLLAEAQQAEELRRQDPIKRAIMGAVAIVVLVLAWIGMLIWQGMQKKGELTKFNAEWTRIKPRFDQIKLNDTLSANTQNKIEKLYQYSTNRHLWAPALNALSQVATNPFATNIQVTRITSEQSFGYLPAILKPLTNASGQVITPARPAGVLERNKMMIFGKDFGRDIDENYTKLKEALADFPYFRSVLEAGGKGLRLIDVSSRVIDPSDATKSYQNFVIECQFAEKFR